MYEQPATALTPALIVYIIDASESMKGACGSTTKIALVNRALRDVLKDMVRRSFRDGIPQQRYHIAIYAYASRVVDVTSGVRDLASVLEVGIPEVTAGGETDTSAAFAAAELLLQRHLTQYQRCPAPLVCHLTDGKFTTADPTPIIRRIQAMQVPDGNVLVENIFVANNMLRNPVADWAPWGGVKRAKDLADEYAQFFFDRSSPLPESYRINVNNYGYALEPGA
ncbi:MAG: VWA domain-containing protein, partial [Ktedonobacterales bacterium]|nr:VWA domain-containing protein [Ktedonobacterales bacterium]